MLAASIHNHKKNKNEDGDIVNAQRRSWVSKYTKAGSLDSKQVLHKPNKPKHTPNTVRELPSKLGRANWLLQAEMLTPIASSTKSECFFTFLGGPNGQGLEGGGVGVGEEQHEGSSDGGCVGEGQLADLIRPKGRGGEGRR